MSDFKTRIVVLISGSGTNLQALIDTIERGDIDAKICAVVSNVDNVAGIERAANHGIPAFVVNHKSFPNRESFDERMIEIIDSQGPDLVVLAGFMRILTPVFTDHYAGRILNIHPSLLPKYQGLNTHQRAIDAGDNEHGATIHFVTADLDGGPIIIQSKVSIEENETAASLAKKVQKQEHLIYPLVVKWFSDGRLQLIDDCCQLDGEALQKNGIQFDQSIHKLNY